MSSRDAASRQMQTELHKGPEPYLCKTKSGVVYDAAPDAWAFRDEVVSVHINFEYLYAEAPHLLSSAKKMAIWYLERYSPAHAMNMMKSLRHMIREVGEPSMREIGDEHLVSYASRPDVQKKGYLSTLSGLLKNWNLLGYPGVTNDAVKFLGTIRKKGNKKGEAVRTMDPIQGPLTSMETEALLDALAESFGDKETSVQEYLIAWLTITLGMRPKQFAAMKVCDLIVNTSRGGEKTYLLNIPRGKQQGVDGARSLLKKRAIIPEVGRLLEMHVHEVRQMLATELPDTSQAPLFVGSNDTKQPGSKGFEFHLSAHEFSAEVKRVLAGLKVRSERTGQEIHITPVRFRRAVGTRAAEEGHGVLVIAELLDHSDTQNAAVYVETTPAIIERIDRAVAVKLAPLAQAFKGKLIGSERDATRANDPSSRIVDLRIDQSGTPMGSCGQHSFCGFGAPIACYRCSCFEPWLDGPHEAVLSYLIEKRESLIETADERIAKNNDLTILAVAEVARMCEEVKSKKKALTNG